jgi:hypothetical protein
VRVRGPTFPHPVPKSGLFFRHNYGKFSIVTGLSSP